MTETTTGFDHHSAEHAADPVASYRDIRDSGGFTESDLHGGFTAVTRYADICAVARDHGSFSSALELPGGDGHGGGITLPHNPAAKRMSLAEMDGPDWQRLRKLLNPTLSPSAVTRFARRIQEITNAFIDRFIESGECDLVLDMASPVPAVVTLAYVGLPTEEWERYAVPIHTSVFTPREPGHPQFEALLEGFGWIFQQIHDLIADRRARPADDDLISLLIEAGLDDETVFEAVYTMLAAGVDTTTSLLSTAFRHLSEHPDDRARLIADPSGLDHACEEFLRYYSPAQAVARTASTDVEVAGHHFERGDRVLLALASANRDPELFDNPDDFRIDRQPNRHTAFGFGIHRCIGAHLARQEFIVVMGEVLRRLPDFHADLDGAPRYPDVGLMFGYERMPAVFTPGFREGHSH